MEERITTNNDKIEAVISTFYQILSGRADEPRDWDRFRSLFTAGAAVIPASISSGPKEAISALSVTEYAERLAFVLSRTDFFETASVRGLQIFGGIAQAVCIYEARRQAGAGSPIKQGVHFVQLVRVGEEWRIAGMIWQDASEDRPLPPEYR